MSNVTFPRKEIEKNIKLTKETIEKISLFGTPLEKLGDKELTIEVFPNRPDLLSLQGFLRAFKPFLGKETGLKKYKVEKPTPKTVVKIDSSVKDVRPFTTCAIVKGIKFNDEKIKEIIELQEKLHTTIGRNRKKAAIGIYPLEKIKLPITYKALPPEKIKFTPLEETREMNGRQVLTKNPTGRNYAHLLQNLKKYPIFVDAKSNILSMPPIINSHETGKITESTKDVFVECSGFHMQTLKKVLNIILTTLADMSGTIQAMKLDYGKNKTQTPDFTPQKIKVSLENINKLLGLELKEKQLEKLLAKMGHDYKNKTVFVPAWRSDILHEVDIAEDVAIAFGYENLSPEIPEVATIAEESKETAVTKKFSEILLGLGLTEISSYHLLKKQEVEKLKIQTFLEVEDSKTDYKILRPTLFPSALRTLKENKDNEYPQKIFEIGTVFTKDDSDSLETGVSESENLMIALSPANFTEAKQILEYLAKTFGFDISLAESSRANLIPGRTADILLNGKPAGYIGEVHPETLRSWSINMPLAFIEFTLNDFFG